MSVPNSGNSLAGESNNGSPSFQQQMMWDRLHNGLAEIKDANRDLRSRAGVVLAGSTAAFGIVSAVTIVPESKTGWVLVPLVLAGLTVLAMSLIAGGLWKPQDGFIVGTSDLNDIYSTYIATDLDSAYNLAMSDAASVFEDEKSKNVAVADRLRWMLWGLDAQIIMLILVVIFFQ